jgi:ATP phosphoribosyltransferase regulatory subunit
MIHPVPSGTRDVLPDEMRELHAITATMRGVFEQAGYGEIHTPALEFESVLRRGDPEAARPAYRFFDEDGRVLVLRSDMTIPIARVVATRYSGVEPPLRFSYFAHAYRAVKPQRGEAREQLQAGLELVGAPGSEGSAEALTVLCRALDAAGLKHYRVGVGDAGLYPSLLETLRVPMGAHRRLLHELTTRDFVGLEREIAGLHLPAEHAEQLLKVPQMRGGEEVLAHAPNLKELHGLLPQDVRSRVIFDLGLARDLGYYTGAIFEVYDAALGVPIGGGGRYDDLLGRFGRPLPAVGWALDVERVHGAVVGER